MTRAGNDGSIALLGSVDSTSTSSQTGGNYHYVGIVLGLTISYHDGTAGIDQFFTDLASGAVNPAIIVTAGTGSGNDLSFADGAALTANATAIAAFVNSGGGLIGHGSGSDAFGWLSTLLPGITFPGGCSSSTLSLTPDGIAAFPSLNNSDIRSGPCHGNFAGNLGGLGILATDGSNRNIILGGAQVTIQGNISLSPATDTNTVGTTHTVTATAQDGSPLAAAVGVTVTFTVNSGPNNGTTGTGTSPTNGAGQASFTYTGSGGAGTDTIVAQFIDAAGATQTSNTVRKIWEVPADQDPPDVVCSETTNPSGKKKPTAGKNPKSGQNPDGFYILNASDSGSGLDPTLSILIRDKVSGVTFGPFPDGTKIKLTQAPGATPSIKVGAGVIDWKIKFNGDAEVSATDLAGNTTTVDCLVPPPPK